MKLLLRDVFLYVHQITLYRTTHVGGCGHGVVANTTICLPSSQGLFLHSLYSDFKETRLMSIFSLKFDIARSLRDPYIEGTIIVFLFCHHAYNYSKASIVQWYLYDLIYTINWPWSLALEREGHNNDFRVSWCIEQIAEVQLAYLKARESLTSTHYNNVSISLFYFFVSFYILEPSNVMVITMNYKSRIAMLRK